MIQPVTCQYVVSSHQKLLNEFDLVEWVPVRSAHVCLVKLQCFSAGMRRPNSGFTLLSDHDFAKLFATCWLLQMGKASARQASKQQKGLDTIAFWMRDPVKPCVSSPSRERFLQCAGRCSRHERLFLASKYVHSLWFRRLSWTELWSDLITEPCDSSNCYESCCSLIDGHCLWFACLWEWAWDDWGQDVAIWQSFKAPGESIYVHGSWTVHGL